MVILDCLGASNYLCPKSGRGRRESAGEMPCGQESEEGKCKQLLEVKGKKLDLPVESQKGQQPADPLILTQGDPHGACDLENWELRQVPGFRPLCLRSSVQLQESHTPARAEGSDLRGLGSLWALQDPLRQGAQMEGWMGQLLPPGQMGEAGRKQ